MNHKAEHFGGQNTVKLLCYTKNSLTAEPPYIALNLPMFPEMKSAPELEVPKAAGLGAEIGR